MSRLIGRRMIAAAGAVIASGWLSGAWAGDLNDAVRPTPPERAYPPPIEAMMAAAPAASERILLVGDSIAFRWPARHRDRSLRQPSFNFGVSRDRTENVLYRLDKVDFSRTRFDTAIVIIGTNNTAVNTPSEIYDGIVEVVRRIGSATRARSIKVLSVLPRGDFLEARRDKIEAVNTLLRQGQASNGYSFIDAYSDFLEQCQMEKNCHLLKDGLHPNLAGYDLIARKLLASR